MLAIYGSTLDMLLLRAVVEFCLTTLKLDDRSFKVLRLDGGTLGDILLPPFPVSVIYSKNWYSLARSPVVAFNRNNLVS